jgi:hypothetical protein
MTLALAVGSEIRSPTNARHLLISGASFGHHLDDASRKSPPTRQCWEPVIAFVCGRGQVVPAVDESGVSSGSGLPSRHARPRHLIRASWTSECGGKGPGGAGSPSPSQRPSARAIQTVLGRSIARPEALLRPSPESKPEDLERLKVESEATNARCGSSGLTHLG